MRDFSKHSSCYLQCLGREWVIIIGFHTRRVPVFKLGRVFALFPRLTQERLRSLYRFSLCCVTFPKIWSLSQLLNVIHVRGQTVLPPHGVRVTEASATGEVNCLNVIGNFKVQGNGHLGVNIVKRYEAGISRMKRRTLLSNARHYHYLRLFNMDIYIYIMMVKWIWNFNLSPTCSIDHYQHFFAINDRILFVQTRPPPERLNCKLQHCFLYILSYAVHETESGYSRLALLEKSIAILIWVTHTRM